MGEADEFEYDVLISYPDGTAASIRPLVERLENDGLKVWFLDREVKAGVSTAEALRSALERTRILIVALTGQKVGSEAIPLDDQTRRFHDRANPRFRLIPLNLGDTRPGLGLVFFASFDWKKHTDAEYARLLARCRPGADEIRREAPDRWILPGHKHTVTSVSLAADGLRAASGSIDGTVRVWDRDCASAAWTCAAVLKGRNSRVHCLALAGDGLRVVSGSGDSVLVWERDPASAAWAFVGALEGQKAVVVGVALAGDGLRVISGSSDGTVRVWERDPASASWTCAAVLGRHENFVWGVALAADGQRAVSGSEDGTVRVWERDPASAAWAFAGVLAGQKADVLAVALARDGLRVIGGSNDGTVRVWERDPASASWTRAAVLEGHKGSVNSVALAEDGPRVVSGSSDGTVRVWERDPTSAAWTCTVVLEGHTGRVLGVALSEDGRRAVSGSRDGIVRVWELPAIVSAGAIPEDQTIYTNAKVLLTGDSGVGKSGLAERLVSNSFTPKSSTVGAWATLLKLDEGGDAPKDVQREIWLWDFAGQADYRLIHLLYMDETALALLVFNPQEEDPFEGLAQWDHDLTRAARGRPFLKRLVAGRCDVASLRASRAELERFRVSHGFADYHETSAETGQGCAELRQAIIDAIPWNSLPRITSPKIFKRIKEETLRLKDEGRVVLRMADLKLVLEARMGGAAIEPQTLEAVVRLLAGAGAVWALEFGTYVLLNPELINAYGGALARELRNQPDELGAIEESRLLAGEFMPPKHRIERDDETVVLQAMLATLLSRGLCLLERVGAGNLLVFPAFFGQKRPESGEFPRAFVRYHFAGSLDEIYTTLVVRLHYTDVFDKDKLYKDAADFTLRGGGDTRRAGIKLTRLPESHGEITVFLDQEIPDEIKVVFMRYVHNHLHVPGRAEGVERTRFYYCDVCKSLNESHEAIRSRLAKGEVDVGCPTCDGRIPLRDKIEEAFESPATDREARKWDEKAQAVIDTQSRERILVGEVTSIVAQAGQIFQEFTTQDWGIDGQIEFKTGGEKPEASGKKIYLQLKSGDSHLKTRKRDGKEIFAVKKRHVEYWMNQPCPVYLVIGSSGRVIRWMEVSSYLKKKTRESAGSITQIEFDGKPFDVPSILVLRDLHVPRAH